VSINKISRLMAITTWCWRRPWSFVQDLGRDEIRGWW